MKRYFTVIKLSQLAFYQHRTVDRGGIGSLKDCEENFNFLLTHVTTLRPRAVLKNATTSSFASADFISLLIAARVAFCCFIIEEGGKLRQHPAAESIYLVRSLGEKKPEEFFKLNSALFNFHNSKCCCCCCWFAARENNNQTLALFMEMV